MEPSLQKEGKGATLSPEMVRNLKMEPCEDKNFKNRCLERTKTSKNGT